VPTYDAILPAGGRIDPAFAERVGTDVKALIKFGDKTILERTLEALSGTERVGRTIVIGGQEVQAAASGLASEVLSEGASGPDNILKGLKHLLASPNPPKKVMVVTTDLPYLTPEILNRFLDACPDASDICVPLINKKDWFVRFPNSTATFATLSDGTWTTGCAYLIDVSALESAMPQIERVFKNRKNVIGMARLLGPKFLFKFVRKTLNVPDVELKISSMLGCKGAAIRNAPTELAYDIDALDDYEYAIGHFSGGPLSS
jgi:molybdopterin-guanine dinucleotide biosynthesis protein A